MRILTSSKFWRILEPILLGSITNIIVNVVFDPSNPINWWSKTEFVVAILFCIPITELNRWVEKKLKRKYGSVKMHQLFFYQLMIVSFLLLLLLNVVGKIYHWLVYDDFYKWGEILLINLILFSATFFLIVSRWAYQFYKRLKITEHNLDKSNQEVDILSSKLNVSNQMIILKKRNEDFSLETQDIRLARIDFGNTKVFDDKNTSYIFKGSLTELVSLLPENLFFQVTRNVILHRKAIKSMSSLPYGKIQLKLFEEISDISETTVSRPKASSFRKWYYIN